LPGSFKPSDRIVGMMMYGQTSLLGSFARLLLTRYLNQRFQQSSPLRKKAVTLFLISTIIDTFLENSHEPPQAILRRQKAKLSHLQSLLSRGEEKRKKPSTKDENHHHLIIREDDLLVHLHHEKPKEDFTNRYLESHRRKDENCSRKDMLAFLKVFT
jgi:hypothetical protein